jgi:hypothetical protein
MTRGSAGGRYPQSLADRHTHTTPCQKPTGIVCLVKGWWSLDEGLTDPRFHRRSVAGSHLRPFQKSSLHKTFPRILFGKNPSLASLWRGLG